MLTLIICCPRLMAIAKGRLVKKKDPIQVERIRFSRETNQVRKSRQFVIPAQARLNHIGPYCRKDADAIR